MKAIEREEIEVALTNEMRTVLIKDLDACVKTLSTEAKSSIPQYKFLESVSLKCQNYNGSITISARECSTLLGFCQFSPTKSQDKIYKLIYDVLDSELYKWEAKNPE